MSPCHNTTILEAREVTREVNRKGKTTRTVDTISFIFKKSSIYNIVGPSGAGKTSFLRLLNRLDEPTSGEIFFYDKMLPEYPPPELRKRVSMIFQEPYLFTGTVKDNLDFCCPDKKLENYAFHLERVGLRPEFAEKESSELSVGEKQRVALARSLVMNPEVLLLDEPTAALDPTSAQTIEHLILSLASELCLTAIMVTHNPEQAKRMGGRALLLFAGKLIESGDTDELLANPSTEQGRRYINRELR
jgi:putative ABC transport system ATP-binding protein